MLLLQDFYDSAILLVKKRWMEVAPPWVFNNHGMATS